MQTTAIEVSELYKSYGDLPVLEGVSFAVGVGDIFGISGGQRQRLLIALAMINRPRLLFLDELTQGLDPVARRETWQLIEQARDQGTTVVLVTHDMEEAERLCDRVAILHEGRLLICGPP